MATATNQQLTDQVNALMSQITELTTRLAQFEGTNAFGPASAHGVLPNYQANMLFDKKMFAPEKFEKLANFREWTDDFMDYVDMCDEQIGDLLKTARDTDRVITQMGQDDATVKKSKALYRILRRCVEQPEAKAIVVNVEEKNIYEAWRQLFAKFDPRNDASANMIITKLMYAALWKCKKIPDIPLAVGKWEALQREHKTRSGEDALNEASKREVLKQMILEDVRMLIDIQTTSAGT